MLLPPPVQHERQGLLPEKLETFWEGIKKRLALHSALLSFALINLMI
jgi:hypothetical protein